MKTLLPLTALLLFIFSCSSGPSKEEIALKQKELELKERELALLESQKVKITDSDSVAHFTLSTSSSGKSEGPKLSIEAFGLFEHSG